MLSFPKRIKLLESLENRQIHADFVKFAASIGTCEFAKWAGLWGRVSNWHPRKIAKRSQSIFFLSPFLRADFLRNQRFPNAGSFDPFLKRFPTDMKYFTDYRASLRKAGSWKMTRRDFFHLNFKELGTRKRTAKKSRSAEVGKPLTPVNSEFAGVLSSVLLHWECPLRYELRL